MSLFSPTTKSYLFCLTLWGLGNALSIPEALAQDFSSTAIPRSSGNLIEKKDYHQSRIRGMKQNLNDYGTQVYDLRVRFDRIFKNRATNFPPPVGFSIEPAPSFPPPDNRPRMIDRDLSGNRPISRANPREKDSPLAFVVEQPRELQPRQIVQDDVGKQSAKEPEADPTKSVSQRKFDYYFLPRLGMSFPSENEYSSGFAFAASGGVVRDDWRFGANFNYSSSDYSSTWLPGSPSLKQGEVSAYSLLVTAGRDIQFDSDWIASVSLGIGGGWSNGKGTIQATPTKTWAKEEGGFAWQLGLGARRPFGETSSLFLGYRYLGHPTVPAHNLEIGAEVGF